MRPIIFYTSILLIFIGLTIFINELFIISVFITVVPIIMVIPFSFIKLKRVNTKRGIFYLDVDKNAKLTLYRDMFFYLKTIDTDYHTSIDNTKKWIKAEVDYIFINEFKTDELRHEISTWDGFLDKSDSRDHNIKKVTS